jgi:hypothetical protein
MSLPHNGTVTSIAAANSIRHIAGGDAERCFNYIKKHGAVGATDDELEVALNLKHQTASARRRGLVLEDRVENSGQQRKTRSGRNAIVWVAK